MAEEHERPRRNTRQREVVLEELRKLTSHPTASELYEIARHRLPRISLGTVYRNLQLLADIGTICKMETAGSEARYDANVTPHSHVRCVCCGRVDDAHGVTADLPEDRIKNLGGYDILGYRLEFDGICPDCRGDAETG
jgi:Fur family ferric uptake transcriptional regulator